MTLSRTKGVMATLPNALASGNYPKRKNSEAAQRKHSLGERHVRPASGFTTKANARPD
jgi:hypothetical protein